MEPARAPIHERQDALDRFVRRLVAELQPLQLRSNLAVWLANTTGEAAHQEESARLDTELRTLFSRPDAYARLREWVAAGGIDDPLRARQLALLEREHRAHQIAPQRIAAMVRLEKELEGRFNRFRALLEGRPVTDNELRDLLRGSGDVAMRRRAWEASKQVGARVAPELLDLVRQRNEAARSLGFDHYYAMMLELDELEERELFAWLDELEAGTRAGYQAYKVRLDLELARRFRLHPEALRPWHYGDPFFQEAPVADMALDRRFEGRSLEGLTERFFGELGFDVRDLIGRSDLYERPGKCQHAFCLCVDRGRDIRVLCNLRANEFWMGTMLHEFGHAVYDQNIDPALPYVLRLPAHVLVTEASAMLFGRLSKNAAWLQRYAGVSPGEAAAAGEALARATRAQLLVQTRWCLVMCHMERELYRDPGQDLDALWWDLVERFQGVPRAEDRHAPDWASKIHFVAAPVYYQNYVLGEMAASHLQRHIHDEVLGGGPDVWARYVSSPAVGTFMRERVYRSGKSADWRSVLAGATGRRLDASALVADLAGVA